MPAASSVGAFVAIARAPVVHLRSDAARSVHGDAACCHHGVLVSVSDFDTYTSSQRELLAVGQRRLVADPARRFFGRQFGRQIGGAAAVSVPPGRDASIRMAADKLPPTPENVETVLGELRPLLITNGGNISLMEIDGHIIRLQLKLTGAGSLNPSLMTMMKEIKQKLKGHISTVTKVVIVDEGGKELTAKRSIRSLLEDILGKVDAIPEMQEGFAKMEEKVSGMEEKVTTMQTDFAKMQEDFAKIRKDFAKMQTTMGVIFETTARSRIAEKFHISTKSKKIDSLQDVAGFLHVQNKPEGAETLILNFMEKKESLVAGVSNDILKQLSKHSMVWQEHVSANPGVDKHQLLQGATEELIEKACWFEKNVKDSKKEGKAVTTEDKGKDDAEDGGKDQVEGEGKDPKSNGQKDVKKKKGQKAEDKQYFASATFALWQQLASWTSYERNIPTHLKDEESHMTILRKVMSWDLATHFELGMAFATFYVFGKVQTEMQLDVEGRVEFKNRGKKVGIVIGEIKTTPSLAELRQLSQLLCWAAEVLYPEDTSVELTGYCFIYEHLQRPPHDETFRPTVDAGGQCLKLNRSLVFLRTREIVSR